MKKIIKGVTIGDLHFGIRDSKRIYEELCQFKKFVEENEIDLLIINGDYFDCKLSLNDSASFFAISFFNELFNICKRKKIKLRILQGTRSHDLNQLSIFQSYTEDPDSNFLIIYKIQEEEIFSGMNILYIPEEYPKNSDEYYKEFRKKKYAIIFGHGTWDFVSQDSQILLGNRTDIHSAPVFKWEEWKDSIEGFVSFGHIHGRNTYRKKIFYSGAFSRWEYGERSDRGFSYFDFNIETREYNIKFINNELAPKFDVFSVKDLNINLIETPVEDIKLLLEEKINLSDNLRIDLSGLPKDKQEILKKFFSGNPKIKIEIRERMKILKESVKNKEKFKKFSYITKRQLPLNEVIKRYAKEEFNEELEIKKINEVISNEK